MSVYVYGHMSIVSTLVLLVELTSLQVYVCIVCISIRI
jgi:hypothetical protein